MTMNTHLEGLIERWERGILDADDGMRELRTTLIEEREIKEREVEEENYALWFTPAAIREHFDDDPRVQLASDERLLRVGMGALSCDVIYEAFHEALKDALENEGIRA